MAESPPGQEHEAHVATDRPRPDRAWWFRVVVPIGFFVVGMLVYSLYLGEPSEEVFDELHYLTAARAFAEGEWMNPDWGDSRPYNWEHPPLAKYWLALTIKVFGDDAPEHYRLPVVLYGAAGLAGMSVLARRLFRSDLAGVIAPFLLLLDPMWYVQSRIALLEIFVAAPMVWAFAFAFGDRDWEPWAAIGAASLALAAKYAALFLFPALFLIILWRRVGVEARGLFGFREALRAFVLVFIVPVLFVLATWAPFLRIWIQDRGIVYAFDHTWFIAKESLSWGASGPTEHVEASAPMYWLPMFRPTWYWVHWGEGERYDQTVGTIFALGNPVTWWLGLIIGLVILVPVLLRLIGALRLARLDAGAYRVEVRPNDWVALSTVGVAFLIFVSGYAPFFLLSRIAFLYYMTLLVPYIALIGTGAIIWILARTRQNEAERVAAAKHGLGTEPVVMEAGVRAALPRGWEFVATRAVAGRIYAIGFCALALGVALLWIPLYTGLHVERIWIERAWDLIPWAERLMGDVPPPTTAAAET